MAKCMDCSGEAISGKGDGKCRDCAGLGVLQPEGEREFTRTCRNCGGNGQCPTCFGEGEV